MKKRSIYLIIALAMLLIGSLSSCDKITELLEVTLDDFAYPVIVSVDITSSESSPYAFSGTGDFDGITDPDEDEYVGDIIHAVNVKSISIIISDLAADSEIELLDGVFTLTDDVTGKSLTYEINEPITITPYMEFVIDPSTTNYGIVEEIIKDIHQSTITINGHVNQDEIYLTFMYTIVADVTIGVPSI